MDNYTSLIMGAATGAIAFGWIMLRIWRSERNNRNRRSVQSAQAYTSSATHDYTRRPDVAMVTTP